MNICQGWWGLHEFTEPGRASGCTNMLVLCVQVGLEAEGDSCAYVRAEPEVMWKIPGKQ